MKRFDLISMADKVCPTTFTFLNSRGGVSCVDTFLISRLLFVNGRVTSYEVLDFIEHGSDHSPVYLRVHFSLDGRGGLGNLLGEF